MVRNYVAGDVRATLVNMLLCEREFFMRIYMKARGSNEAVDTCIHRSTVAEYRQRVSLSLMLRSCDV